MGKWVCQRIDYSSQTVLPTIHDTEAGAIQAGEVWVWRRPEDRGYNVHKAEETKL